MSKIKVNYLHMNFLSSNIKFLRNKTGLKQAEFGELFGCTRDNIASYERNSEPKLEVVKKIVDYFHITFEQLYSCDLNTQSPNFEYPIEYPIQSNDEKEVREGVAKFNKIEKPPGECILCSEKQRVIDVLNSQIEDYKVQRDKLYSLIEKLTDNHSDNSHEDQVGKKRNTG